MKKLFISIIICSMANIIFAQTSFNNVTTITPSSLTQLSGNIYQKDNTKCLLYGHNHEDKTCITSRESEVISFAIRNLAVEKYGSWNNAEFTPIFIENNASITENVEQNLISTLNVAKTKGIPSISFEPARTIAELSNIEEATFDATFNTINYGKLQHANDTNLIKNTLNKGYPIIVYFKHCVAYQRGIDYHNVWDEFVPVNTKAASSESYLTAIIVGYKRIGIPSTYQEKQCFVMYCPKEKDGDSDEDDGKWGTSIIYVPFDSVAQNIFDYAIVPHSLSPYKCPTEIKGPNYLSCTKTYQVSNLPPSATISWRKESFYLSISAGQNTPTVTVNPVFIASRALPGIQLQSPKLIATITINGKTKELTKDIEIVENIAPSVTLKGATSSFIRLTIGKTYTFQVTNAELSDNSSLVWDITLPNGTKQYKTGKEVNITPTSGGGYLKINIENLDGCQPNNTSSYSYFVAPLIQMQYNNPASETLNIQIIEQNNNSRTLSSETNYYSGEYSLELYDQNTTLIRKINCEENTPQIQIPVSDLISGYYYLRLIIDGQIIDVKQVIIN